MVNLIVKLTTLIFFSENQIILEYLLYSELCWGQTYFGSACFNKYAPPSVCDVTFDLSQNYENLHNTVYRTVKILFKTSMAPQDRAKIKYDPPLTGLADEECFLCI